MSETIPKTDGTLSGAVCCGQRADAPHPRPCVIVRWPGQGPVLMCGSCAEHAHSVAEEMGFFLDVEGLYRCADPHCPGSPIPASESTHVMCAR